jgi:hypothetical protein
MDIKKEIKQLLVKLAVENKIPSDMNELDEEIFDPIIETLTKEMKESAEISALDEYLSEYPKEKSFDEILKIISTGEADEDESGIIVWEPFENTDPGNLVDYIQNSKDYHFERLKVIIHGQS